MEAPAQSSPASFTPFTGSGNRMSDELPTSPPRSASQPSESWAITFASNLQLVRSSRKRSTEAAQKKYHWRCSGFAPKATRTGTESYSKGKQAGEKRKAQIDSSAGSAKEKFKKGARLAIAE